MFGREKIDYLIIGAQKSGTTSLYRYLTAHLLLPSAKSKEIHYFNLNYNKGDHWYHSHFDFEARCLQGEATPYYLFDKLSAERAYKYNSKLKIIVILRNPVDRAFSHYQMNVRHKVEELSFFDALQKEEERLATSGPLKVDSPELLYSYKKRGLYAEQLKNWSRYFSPHQMVVLKYEEFFKDPKNNIQRLYKFLDVAPYFGDIRNYHFNAGDDLQRIPKDAARYLDEYFEQPNKALASEYGIQF